jgi:dTDP-4-dehydrorhamnose reductase
MRVLIIGASGLLGAELVRAFQPEAEVTGTYHRHSRPGLVQLDLLAPGDVLHLASQTRPDVVLLPAAEPNVDACEADPRGSRRINVGGVAAALEACEGARTVFISTDYVFDGESPPYTEDRQVRPLNEYGHQKAEAERLVLSASPHNLVVRTAWLYGWEAQGKNFVMRALERLRLGEEVQAAAWQHGTPTYVPDLADAIRALVKLGAEGVLHVAGPESLTRVEHAALVAQVFGCDPHLIRPVGEDDVVQRAPRPRDPSLDSTRAGALLGRSLLRPAGGLAAMRDAESL